MRILSICVLFLGLNLNMAFSDQDELNSISKPFAVVELFASEGCSSCPPADDVLAQLNQEAQKDNKNIFILSFAVDYWDYLGWKDPHSSSQFTQRQHQYAQALESSSVYTPQIIINGVHGFVGSDEVKARQYIKQSLDTSPSNAIKLKVQNTGHGPIEIKYQCQRFDEGAVLNIALVERDVQSQVTAGENEGRLLRHTNIVREFKTIRLKEKDGAVLIEVPKTDALENHFVIAYIQEEKSMKIIAASGVYIR
jgi:hypothetical protein